MKAKYRLQIISLFILLVAASSCSQFYYLQVQTSLPGKKELPENIQSLALINRTVDSRYKNYPEDTLQQQFYIKRFSLDTVLYDITAADTALKALGDLLYESGRYDIVIPEDRFLKHDKNAFVSSVMTWDEAEDICNTFNTDAVLSFDYFKTSISTTYKPQIMYDEAYDRYLKAYMAAMAIQYEAMLRVYDPANKKILSRMVIKDTLWWEDMSLSNKTLFNRFTSVKDAMVESGIAIALDYSDQLGTQWRNAWRRYYYTGNNQFKEAHLFAKKSDWEEALERWLIIAEQARGKALRSKAEYNVAFGYEMLGDIDNAIRWGLKSYESFYRPLTVEYLKILKKRKLEIDKNARKK